MPNIFTHKNPFVHSWLNNQSHPWLKTHAIEDYTINFQPIALNVLVFLYI